MRKPPKRLFRDRQQPEPELPGPEGLKRWTLSFPEHWASAYRAARKLRQPADIVVSSTPHNDRTSTPPRSLHILTRAEAARMVPRLAASLSQPAEKGMFYVMATKRFGRLQGSFLGMLSVPGEDEDLPTVVVGVGDSTVGVVV